MKILTGIGRPQRQNHRAIDAWEGRFGCRDVNLALLGTFGFRVFKDF